MLIFSRRLRDVGFPLISFSRKNILEWISSKYTYFSFSKVRLKLNLEKMFAEVITSKYLSVFLWRHLRQINITLLTKLRQIVECLEFVGGIS